MIANRFPAEIRARYL